MNKTFITFATPLLLLCSLISGCHEEDAVSSDLDPYVENPAYALLLSTGSLHTFTVSSFIEDSDIRNDIMVLNFNNFTPPSSNIEPRPDEDQTTNDLGWTQNAWDEVTRNWTLINSPKSVLPYNKPRQYRLLNADTNNLDAPITTLNYPIYEAIKKNVYEKQLGAIFVWDFGSYTKDVGEKVGGKKMIDYQTFFGFDLLPHVDKWGIDITNSNRKLLFSSKAIIYGATYSVAKDTLTVESVYDGSNYILSKTKFGTGQSDIETALLNYPQGGTRLEYNFTLNYSANNKIYMSFDTVSKIAYLYPEASGIVELNAPYTLHTNPDYLEINTSAMTDSEHIILKNLPTYFNPIITGPFTDNGNVSSDPSQKSFFYGKHYIKTDAISRLKLQPVFMFNPSAKADIENAFKQWRLARHIEEDL